MLEDTVPSQRPIRADTAFVMTNLLRGVVQRGTGAKAAALNWPIGGKTGTTDDYTDAWFIGFDPDITIGLWLGYDQKRTMGPGGTGADAALPIWIEIMKAWLATALSRHVRLARQLVSVVDGCPEIAGDVIAGAINESCIPERSRLGLANQSCRRSPARACLTPSASSSLDEPRCRHRARGYVADFSCA